MKRNIYLIGGFFILANIIGCYPSSESTNNTNVSIEGSFTNPIFYRGNDPWVVYHEDHYYLIESWDGGIWITKSPYRSLSRIGDGTRVKVFSYPTEGPNCSPAWAPELHYINEKWYIYYAAGTCDDSLESRRMFVLEGETSDPLGSYIDKGQITDPTDKWAIDGSILYHDDQMYFIWSGWRDVNNGIQNNYIAPMSNPWTISGERVLLSTPNYEWEMRGGNGQDAPFINEGPTALYNNGSISVVYSASGSWTDDYGYGLLTFTGGDVLDPNNWVKSQSPIFSRTSEVFGPGHGSFVKSPDGTEDWMIYHSARFSGSGWDRILNIQEFDWNEDGTPNFGEPIPPGVEHDLPSGEPPLETEK